jgi:phosphatidylserine/phosphatidylglycerophosphate/cardiolipin synthase-like enzyme
VARGYTKAVRRARRLVYVEDQYFWGDDVADTFLPALREHPGLRLVVVIPLFPDVEGRLSRPAELLGRTRALKTLIEAAPGRVAAYGLENHAGTPVYVHAKVCVMDDVWASVGSDNFNRRSWTHDSELSAIVLDSEGEYARRLRLTLASEHLGRGGDPGSVDDCVEPDDMYAAFERAAAGLDDWYAGGRVGPRPTGRLRRLHPPEIPRWKRALALPLYLRMHDPDGRPGPLRKKDEF